MSYSSGSDDDGGLRQKKNIKEPLIKDEDLETNKQQSEKTRHSEKGRGEVSKHKHRKRTRRITNIKTKLT